MKKIKVLFLLFFVFIMCQQNILAGNNIFYSQMKEAINLAEKQNKDFFPGSFSGRINQNKELLRCQILFYRPVEEIPGSYEVFNYNYKEGKVTTKLKEKKDNNVFYSRNLDFIENMKMNQLPNLKGPNTFFSFKLFGITPYLYLSEKLELNGEKVTHKIYLDEKYRIIPYDSDNDFQEYQSFINRTILSLNFPNAQEAFIIAKKALEPWRVDYDSACLLKINGDLRGLYLEQILKGRADLWKVTLSVGQNIYKVEIGNGVPLYIDNLSSSSGQAVSVPDSQEMIRRLEKDGGKDWREGLGREEWYVHYSYPENGQFRITYHLNELRLDKKSFLRFY